MVLTSHGLGVSSISFCRISYCRLRCRRSDKASFEFVKVLSCLCFRRRGPNSGNTCGLPELSIGVIAAIEGTSSFGFGIILGSNVADLTLVIGVVILFAGKLNLNPTVLKQLRISFLAVILPVLLLLDGELSSVDGVILLGAFVVYSVWLVTRGRDGGESSKRGDLFGSQLKWRS